MLIGHHRSVVQDTLTTIADRAHDTTVRESVLGSALCAALAALVRAIFVAFVLSLIMLVRQVGVGKWSCSKE